MKPKIYLPSNRVHLNPDIDSRHFGAPVPDVKEVDQTCETCGRVYIALTFKNILWTTGHCFSCSEGVVKNKKEEKDKGTSIQRKNKFSVLCPEKYQNFKRELLPNPGAYDEVLSWNFGKKGLLMVGDSERGKTRCAWQLMRRLYLIENIVFEAITELKFSHEVAKFGRSDSLADWLDKLCRIPVLFIDDLGKSVITERVASELFFVFEERMSNERPIVATMQISSQTFVDKISSRAGKDMASAIMNRLTSNCEMIQF